MTLAEHAEAWWTEQEKQVPERQSEAWEEMYSQWIEFAFSDLRASQGPNA